MLIRTQDKKSLVNFSMALGLSIAYLNGKYQILIHNIANNSQTVKIAEYSAERKALKVIDDIELVSRTYKVGKIVYSGLSVRDFTTDEIDMAESKIMELFNSAVFDMPTENEVE